MSEKGTTISDFYECGLQPSEYPQSTLVRRANCAFPPIVAPSSDGGMPACVAFEKNMARRIEHLVSPCPEKQRAHHPKAMGLSGHETPGNVLIYTLRERGTGGSCPAKPLRGRCALWTLFGSVAGLPPLGTTGAYPSCAATAPREEPKCGKAQDQGMA